MLSNILQNQLIMLLIILALGFALGSLKVRGISLGSSACLFVAIAAGAAGAELSPIVSGIGIVFFVYSIGLAAGPQFFHLFNRRGLKYSFLAISTILIGGVSVVFFGWLLNVSIPTAVGVFAGAMTSTPALASAIGAVAEHFPNMTGMTSIGYAIAYPFGLISEVLFVQIVPRIYAKKLVREKEEARKEVEAEGFFTSQFRLTNINLVGRALEELDLHNMCRVNLTRYKRGEQMGLCLPGTRFELGDIIVAVGKKEELDKFSLLVGEELNMDIPVEGQIEVRDLYISGSKVVGKPLSDLKLPETYGVTITRLYRSEMLITPTGNATFEIGDSVRIIGERSNIEKFIAVAGSERRRLYDTNILILVVGMLLGVAIGEIPLKIGSFVFKLGVAGGPLFVALILGHFGKIGKHSVRIPSATRIFLRELGLVFFLTGIGVKTGSEIGNITLGCNMCGAFGLGVIVSLIAMFASFFIIYKFFKTPLAASLGAMCGAKTSSPSLGVLIKTLDDDSPAIAYAAVYPVAVIMLTVAGQAIVWLAMQII